MVNSNRVVGRAQRRKGPGANPAVHGGAQRRAVWRWDWRPGISGVAAVACKQICQQSNTSRIVGLGFRHQHRHEDIQARRCNRVYEARVGIRELFIISTESLHLVIQR